jgi:hypothetical protein
MRSLIYLALCHLSGKEIASVQAPACIIICSASIVRYSIPFPRFVANDNVKSPTSTPLSSSQVMWGARTLAHQAA